MFVRRVFRSLARPLGRFDFSLARLSLRFFAPHRALLARHGARFDALRARQRARADSPRVRDSSLTLLALCCVVCMSSSALSARADEPTAQAAPTSNAAALTAAPPPVVPPPAPDATPQTASVPPASAVVPAPVTAPGPVVTPAPVNPPPVGAPPPPSYAAGESATPVTRSEREPMNGFAIGFKLGYAGVGTGDVANPTYVPQIAALPAAQQARYGLTGGGCDIVDKRCHTPARRGFNLSIPIQIGGSGVGFRVEPYLTLSDDSKAYGVYTGPTFEFRVAAPLYLGFGLGVKAAYVKVDPWKYAGDLYGRIPLTATWYVTDDVGLLLEFGFGAGASGYYREARNLVIPATATSNARTINKKDIAFGVGRIWDLSVGFRFP